MFGSTGSLRPIAPGNSGLTSWRYTTPTMTTTTSSALDPNAVSHSWGKAANLAKASSKAVRGVLEEQAKQGAKDAVAEAAKYGDTGYGGLLGEMGTRGAGENGEWALGAKGSGLDHDWASKASDGLEWSPTATKDAIAAGEWAPAGEATMNVGGQGADAVAEATAAADQAGQTVADLGASTYGDMVSNMGEQFAEQAAEQAAASQAANAIPMIGTALNVGANLANGNYGAAAGAGAGAAMGSVIPGVGTALGGTIGGLLGSFF